MRAWFGYTAPTVSPPVLPHTEETKSLNPDPTLGLQIFCLARFLRDAGSMCINIPMKDLPTIKTTSRAKLVGLLKTVFRNLGLNEELILTPGSMSILEPVTDELKTYLRINSKELELVLKQSSSITTRKLITDIYSVPYLTSEEIGMIPSAIDASSPRTLDSKIGVYLGSISPGQREGSWKIATDPSN